MRYFFIISRNATSEMSEKHHLQSTFSYYEFLIFSLIFRNFFNWWLTLTFTFKTIIFFFTSLSFVSDKKNLIQRIKVICKRSVRDHYAKKETIKWQHTFIRDYNRFLSCHTMYNTLGCHLKITENIIFFLSLSVSLLFLSCICGDSW